MAPLQGSRVGSRPRAVQLLTRCRLQRPPSMAACEKDIVHTHKFGPSKGIQLLIVVGTAKTVKSYLINAIWQLITERAAASALKVTVHTGIQVAAANIYHRPRCGSVADI